MKKGKSFKEPTLGFYRSSKAQEVGEYRYIGITLSEQNKCEISFSMTGDFFYGKYSAEGNNLICDLTLLKGGYIEDLETDIKYHFEILDDFEFIKSVGTLGKYKSKIDNI